jgi:hypothetical protein
MSLGLHFRIDALDSFYIGLIYVLVIALLMTAGELAFFLLKIAPDEARMIRNKLYYLKDNRDDYINGSILENKSAMDTYLNSTVIMNDQSMAPGQVDQVNKLQQKMNQLSNDIDTVKTNLLNVETIREDQLNIKINNDAIMIIVIEMVLFLFFIGLCYAKIRYKPVWPIVILAIITVFILGGFQGVMYFFAGGLNNHDAFEFITDNELEYGIYSKLKSDLFAGDGPLQKKSC